MIEMDRSPELIFKLNEFNLIFGSIEQKLRRNFIAQLTTQEDHDGPISFTWVLSSTG